MAVHTPTWIYLGHDNTQINPAGHSTGTTEAQASRVVGMTFPGSDMQGVRVSGNATLGSGTNFARGIDALSYSLDNGNGGQDAKSAVYTSHVVVHVAINVAREDPGNPGTTIRETMNLRGVIIQMENGDLFMRPYYTDVKAWDDTLQNWGVTQITIGQIDTTLRDHTFTDHGTNGLNAAATFDPAFFNEGTFVPCFAAGTLILAAGGAVPVETLREGDQVWTRDNGFQRVRWTGSRKVDLTEAPHLAPVRIAAGALGPNVPATELLVSPQHRILVRSNIARRMFGTSEVLVAAKQLLQIEGISLAAEMTEVRYVHILCDRHEVVLSNGAETETLYTGAEAIKAVGPAARDEIFAIFPELGLGAGAPDPARPLASGRMGRQLAGRHARNELALVN